jgi:TPR repeat protein
MHLKDAKLLGAALAATLMLAALGTAAADDPLNRRLLHDQRPANDTQALSWALKAAERGRPNAQFIVGEMYSAGQGTPHDETEATKWYRKAAEQGHPEAQYKLGTAYFNGTGVPKDNVEVLKWWRASAEQGFAEAQFILAVMYLNGKIVPEDDMEAYKWLNLAAPPFRPEEHNDRDIAVAFRDKLRKRMTPAQVAEAQRLTREWKPKPWE